MPHFHAFLLILTHYPWNAPTSKFSTRRILHYEWHNFWMKFTLKRKLINRFCCLPKKLRFKKFKLMGSLGVRKLGWFLIKKEMLEKSYFGPDRSSKSPDLPVQNSLDWKIRPTHFSIMNRTLQCIALNCTCISDHGICSDSCGYGKRVDSWL